MSEDMPPAIRPLVAEELGVHMDQARQEMIGVEASTVEDMAVMLGSQPKPENKTVIRHETRPDGVLQKVAAVAIGRDGRLPHETTMDELVTDARDRTYDELDKLLDEKGKYVSPTGAKESRFANGAEFMYIELFGDREPGRHRAGEREDFTDSDPAGTILKTIIGGEYYQKEPRPLTEPEAEELIGLMPALIAFSDYKMLRWHGYPRALGSVGRLLEHVAVSFPDKIAKVDLYDAVSSLTALKVAAQANIAIVNNTHARSHESAEHNIASYSTVLESFAKVRAKQLELSAPQVTA